MSKKTYITKTAGAALDFAYGYQQCFHHQSSQPRTLPEYTLVKQFVALPPDEKTVTLEVMKFLYQFTFASFSQLERLLTMKGLDKALLNIVLNRMIEDRQANSFYLDEVATTGDAPKDAFIIYCLDFGSLAILTHYSSSSCITWFTTDSYRCSELITKYLNTVEFYLSLAAVQGKNLRYFKPIFDIAFGHREIRFSAAFEIAQEHMSYPFLVESVRSHDLPIEWKDKLDKKLVHFACQERNWKRYFATEPVYLILVENERDALEAADLFYRRTGKDNFRLITDEQVKLGLDKATFLKFVPGADDAEPGTLQKTKASLLSGEQSKK